MPIKSKIELSPHFAQIRQMIAQGKKDGQPIKAIYRQVKELEPNVPNYETFNNFAKKILALIEDLPKRDDELLDKALQKAIQLGDLVLERTLIELKADVEAGNEISWQKRKDLMKWFNESGNMKLRQRFLDIRNKQGMASIAAMALLADAARYGKLSPEDTNIIKGEIIKTKEDDQAERNLQTPAGIPDTDRTGTDADTGAA